MRIIPAILFSVILASCNGQSGGNSSSDETNNRDQAQEQKDAQQVSSNDAVKGSQEGSNSQQPIKSNNQKQKNNTTPAGSKSSSQSGEFTIKGQVSDPNTEVMLDKMGIGNSSLLESTVSDDNGNFEFNGTIDVPGLYRVRTPNNGAQIVLTKGTTQIKPDPNGQGLKVIGSEDTEYLQEFYITMKKYNRKIKQFRKRKENAESNKRKREILDSMKKLFPKIQKRKTKALKDHVEKVDESIVGVLTALYINAKNNTQYLEKVANKYKNLYPKSKFVQELNKKIKKVKAQKPIGTDEEAPEISMNNPNGKKISLSNYKGKYVLIDFWASWCKPCRNANPHMVKMYNKFKDKNFEILGVSLDKKKSKWVQAIQNDGLKWPQVSDLKGWNSRAAQKYNVKSIPATFLVNPKGEIIATNLRGQTLENKLEQVL